MVGSLGMTSKNIEKDMLNFKDKAWWTLARHRLCPTIRENVQTPICIALIIDFMAKSYIWATFWTERYVI